MDKIVWQKIGSYPQYYQAELARERLLMEETPAMIIDRKDSAYTFFGEVELWVPQDFVIRALHLLNTSLDE